MKILIACEESQTVCREMRRLGHETYSCDIQECSGGHPEWHIKGDVLPLINGRCEFVTMDGERHEIPDRWDMLIAHPPCTYLSGVTTRHLSLKMTPPEKVVARMWKLGSPDGIPRACVLRDKLRLQLRQQLHCTEPGSDKPFMHAVFLRGKVLRHSDDRVPGALHKAPERRVSGESRIRHSHHRGRSRILFLAPAEEDRHSQKLNRRNLQPKLRSLMKLLGRISR